MYNNQLDTFTPDEMIKFYTQAKITELTTVKSCLLKRDLLKDIQKRLSKLKIKCNFTPYDNEYLIVSL